MSVSLKRTDSYNPSPGPGDDPWTALLIAIDLALGTGYLTSWQTAATVLVAVLAFFSSYRDSQR
ncbi:hypothetical protein [Nocardia alba]|uniref:Uncharacterized protein n=1 Tax=Nocardia alba TaxID=225051 RepID=A0A4R1FGG5_9NOCA|nr:hypothetical protein [Nocardia alba]TCJ89921.1 hypothetical protein DFR71_6211 [Nocardia alba]